MSDAGNAPLTKAQKTGLFVLVVGGLGALAWSMRSSASTATGASSNGLTARSSGAYTPPDAVNYDPASPVQVTGGSTTNIYQGTEVPSAARGTAAVQRLQEQLADLGYSSPIDGRWGQLTYNAAVDFARAFGIAAPPRGAFSDAFAQRVFTVWMEQGRLPGAGSALGGSVIAKGGDSTAYDTGVYEPAKALSGLGSYRRRY